MSPMFRRINFQKEPLGIYTSHQVAKSWNDPFDVVGVEEGRCRIVTDRTQRKNCLQVSYVKGKVGPKEGGVAWKMKLGQSVDELFAQYKVKFPVGFNYVQGGKLPGVGGGSLPAGGKVADEHGFTVRVMWRGEERGKRGRIVQYVYYLDKDPDYKWGKDMQWNFDNKNLFFCPGKWHLLKTRVKMNNPGKKDGSIQSWLDGKLALDEKVRFRMGDEIGIDTFIFTTFFGGNTEEWAPKKNEHIFFDDFVISTEDIS